jgi:putative transposase
VITSLEEMRRKLDVALWAYVIMPEHVHVLLYPRQADYEMRLILVALKRPVADAAKRHLEQTGNTAWLNRLRVQYPPREVFRF